MRYGSSVKGFIFTSQAEVNYSKSVLFDMIQFNVGTEAQMKHGTVLKVINFLVLILLTLSAVPLELFVKWLKLERLTLNNFFFQIMILLLL